MAAIFISVRLLFYILTAIIIANGKLQSKSLVLARVSRLLAGSHAYLNTGAHLHDYIFNGIMLCAVRHITLS